MKTPSKNYLFPSFTTKVGIQGEYRCVLYNNEREMRVVRDTGWNRNLITNTGLNTIYTRGASYARYTAIGSSAALPAVTDTQLGAFMAISSSAGGSNNILVSKTPPNYELSTTRSRRFNAGIGTGTIREIGLCYGTDSSELFNRQILTPEIEKSAEQILDVIFRITIFPSLVDSIGSILISGVSHNTILRCRDLSTYVIGDAYSGMKPYDSGSVTYQAWSGDIGTYLQSPAGTWSNSNSATTIIDPYINNSHYIDMTRPIGLDNWNIPGGIRSATSATYPFYYQTQFDPVIPKTNQDIMSLTWRLSWARVP